MSAKATQTDEQNRTADTDYRYVVEIDGSEMMSLRSRHAAVGVAAVWNRTDLDQVATVATEPHTSTDELPGLVDEPARGDTH